MVCPCSICLEHVDNTADRATLRCGHTLHASCLVMLAKTSLSCPLCRSPFADHHPAVSKENDELSDMDTDTESEEEEVVVPSMPVPPEPPTSPAPPNAPTRILTRGARIDLFQRIVGVIYHAAAIEVNEMYPGPSIAAIQNAVFEFDAADVLCMIRHMSNEGHVYSTCDDDHFLLTDM